MPKLTLVIRDDETDLETRSYLNIVNEDVGTITSQVAKAVQVMLGNIGHGVKMSDDKEKLDHNQDKTDSIQKSVHPDNDYMKSEGLCTKCHGPLKRCSREDCPN